LLAGVSYLSWSGCRGLP